MRSEPGADGMEQLAEKAHEQEHLRDHEMHRTHELEIASGGLQISIVLASISVVVELPLFMIASIAAGARFRDLRAARRPIRVVVIFKR